ncbi:TRAP transporter permease [Desulfatitalea tepidiphila]|uniref:TRAP transporter permease n=1 Tax=Desulfatitalea tepidiphila TaxID=1185843 RepID=UPI0006B63F0D|nr:TRAP transporter permease [Desulfatitalea tepidiphila]
MEVTKETDNRISLIAQIVRIVAIAMAVFQIYTAQFGLFSALVQRSIHLAFACTLVFLIYPLSKRFAEAYSWRLRMIDWGLAAVAITTLVHLSMTYKTLAMRGGEASTADLWLGGILLLLVLECTRRLMGPALPIITLIAILYTLLGDRIPGMWGHFPIDHEQFISYQYLTTEGLFGIPLGVSASFIFVFIMFGAFLVSSGTGEFFIKFSNALAGHFRGGPAKVAVVSSGFFGTISGSAVANVVSTGSFTIPLMKKIGYRGVFAGAVESVSSTGGQFMPPVMGAGAFIMADMLGVGYLEVVKAAILPGVLYFLALFWMVHMEALKLGLRGLNREELPPLWATIKAGGHLMIPAFLLIGFLIMGYSPMKAGLWAIISVWVISAIRKATRMGFRAVLNAMEKGATGCLEVALACACAGIVIGCVTQTGLGLKFSGLIIDAAGGNLILSLIFVMFASIILGMGLTTSAAYILTVILGGPVLIELGVNPLAAHMFVFYYACLSTVTPPVALASFAGAAIAGSKPFATGFESMRLAAVAYLVPYFFVFSPELIWKGSLGAIGLAAFSATIGTIALGSGLMGYLVDRLNWIFRLLLLAAGVALIQPGLWSDIFGVIVLGGLALYQRWQGRKTVSADAVTI